MKGLFQGWNPAAPVSNVLVIRHLAESRGKKGSTALLARSPVRSVAGHFGGQVGSANSLHKLQSVGACSLRALMEHLRAFTMYSTYSHTLANGTTKSRLLITLSLLAAISLYFPL